MGPNSDFNLLVVVPSGTHRRHTAGTIHRGLVGVGFAADIVLVTTDDLAKHTNNPGLIIQPALNDGPTARAAIDRVGAKFSQLNGY